MTKYICLNCPDQPAYATPEQLSLHWEKTHTVPMEANIELPTHLKAFFPEVTTKKIQLWRTDGK